MFILYRTPITVVPLLTLAPDYLNYLVLTYTF